ncbi:uncharacterized protein B0T15DRAFT_527438 [Chaetomium strumarium]|uniref:Tyrosinase copper-binding domain-containing protein n=1 Tax=Chaetomium strumarium TaxID=1170767 RepID=A0AAJ0GUP1_9PEZI|nr:hypothetical protein B0T15DRAFT_527438 [Chaetomium strumarium]
MHIASLAVGALLLGASHAAVTIVVTATTTICPVPRPTRTCDASSVDFASTDGTTTRGLSTSSTSAEGTTQGLSTSSSSSTSVQQVSISPTSTEQVSISSTTQTSWSSSVVPPPSQTTLLTRTKESSVVSTSTTGKASSASSSSKPSSASSSSTAAAEPTSIPRAYPADVVDKLRDSTVDKLKTYLEGQPSDTGCTLENASVRREWSDLSVAEREQYIAAVKCLQSASPKSPEQLVPGARSRFDDFVATHINQTNSIHNTANFLSWHRYYVWTYEKALREECGYSGFQPYWNWDRYAADPANSPLFNGNASSMSGNSKNGACVSSGPFANFQVNLGPGLSLKYNPRCLKRDISKSQAAQTTADKTYALITRSRDIASFQDTMQGVPGVHAGGHFTIGGDPGSDIFASPGDPVFYLHHAMIDRVWWIWQMQDPSSRLTQVAGSVAGSRRQGKGTDLVDLGINAPAVAINDLLDTMGGLDGQMCYIYL